MKNKHSLWVVFWTVILALSIIFMPNLDSLVRDKGQIGLPAEIQSQQAVKILNELNNDGKEVYDLALVFHNSNGITANEQTEIENVLKKLEKGSQQLIVTNTLFHINSEEVAKQLISEDNTTILAQLSVEKQDLEISEITDELATYLEDVSVDSYITGADVVKNDFASSAQDGVKKTEIFAVGIIIIILLAIFRSPIIPSISLAGVGISYIISLSIITLLVEHFNYPFSNFTQVFLVVVLFGIGTDYNILLFNRFKEELANNDVPTAVKNTYKHAGKTVLLAGCAVGVGFAALIFADFQLYKATSAIFIGIIVLLAILMTLNKFFMLWLGKRIFWPSKKDLGHSENKYWSLLAKVSYKRPIITIVLVLVFSIPVVLMYNSHLNYNDLVEVNDKYESKQAITIIENHFSPGLSSPASLVIEANENLLTQENLVILDEINELIASVEGVEQVFSITRPESEKIDELYIEDQSTTLDENIVKMTDGLQTLSDELAKAAKNIDSDEITSGINALTDGTNELVAGITTFTDAVNQLGNGAQSAAAGSDEIKAGLEQLLAASNQIQGLLEQLSGSYATLQQNYVAFEQLLTQFTTLIDSNILGYQTIQQAMQGYVQANPAAAQSIEVQTVLKVSTDALTQLQAVKAQVAGKDEAFKQLNSYLAEANAGLSQITEGQSQISVGLSSVTEGMNELQTGLNSLATGGKQVVANTPKIADGAQSLADGQQQLADGLQELSKLQSGLTEATDGLNEIKDGVQEVNEYFLELGKVHSSTFYMPQSVLEGETFAKAVDMYMYENNYTTTMKIILAVNPYTDEAMNITKEIDEKLAAYVQSSSLDIANMVIGGTSMQNLDLQEMSQNDFIKSAIVMIIGIGIILIFITRSPYQTMIILASLLLATYTSLGLTQIIVETFFAGDALLGWNVPFFTFISLFSLGVDYSIFLMMRYKETKELGSYEIVQASKQMGGVIFAAMFILSCTFAALIPSGNNSLIQIAIAVIIGLVVFAAIFMPLIIPAAIKLPELFKSKK